MTLATFYKALEGDWQGSYSLWLRPDAPARESAVDASVRIIINGHFLLMTYYWGSDEAGEEGVFLIGGDNGAANATWADSFHMQNSPMQCRGEFNEGGQQFVVTGHYAAGDGPDWGWRTELGLKAENALLMQAFNITPGDEEALAVRAELSRSPALSKSG